MKWIGMDGKPFVPSGGKASSGLLPHSKRKPSPPMPTSGPRPTTAEEIAELRAALLSLGGEVTPPSTEWQPGDAILDKLERVKKRRAHANHARGLAGHKPRKIAPHKDLERERQMLACVLVLAVFVWAWAVFMTPKAKLDAAKSDLTTLITGRCNSE